MRILFIASEALPSANVGGLADVTTSLAIALHNLGRERCLVLPKYTSIEERAQEIQNKEDVVYL